MEISSRASTIDRGTRDHARIRRGKTCFQHFWQKRRHGLCHTRAAIRLESGKTRAWGVFCLRNFPRLVFLAHS